MKTARLLSATSGAVLALGVASSGAAQGPAEAQGYGTTSGYSVPDQSVLKVCKVAGEGVNVGDLYSFQTRPSGGKERITVPAGPGPGGYCQVVGTYETGTVVDLREIIPRGYGIDKISVHPADARVQEDLPAGRIMVKLGRGVTEITLVNVSVQPGWIEICKLGGRDASYRFTFAGINGPETHVVPRGACTPALQVPAGELVVTEVNAHGQMTGGEAWPANRFISADPARGEIRVRIPPNGTIETQTIITFQNRGEPPRDAY